MIAVYDYYQIRLGWADWNVAGCVRFEMTPET